jgi:hypothetical protein
MKMLQLCISTTKQVATIEKQIKISLHKTSIQKKEKLALSAQKIAYIKEIFDN